MIRDKIYNTTKILESTWIVVNRDKELFVLTALSALGLIFIFALAFGLLYLQREAALESGHSVLDFLSSPSGIFLVYLFFLAGYFVMIFFQSGVAGCALMRLEGSDPTLKDGISFGIRNFKNILLWSIITGTFGFLIYLLQAISRGRGGWIFSVLLDLGNIAWTLATFFVVPILVAERRSPIDAIRESKDIFIDRWGEQAFGNFSLWIFFLPFSIPAILLILFGGVIGFAIALIYAIALRVIAATVAGIYRAAVYRFAKTGDVYEGFNEDLLSNAFQSSEGANLA